MHNKKIKQGVEKINEKIKKKYPANSVRGLIGKKVYSESGDYIGNIKDITLGENKIDSLKIKLDKKLDAKSKGIVINWKQIVSCGEILIIDSRILGTIK
jgi:sporulation protein YlmC with PRC-barrel domain